MSLENIHIFLINTTESGNIGAASRAMKNMGLQNLVLINPSCSIDEKAKARSSGADDILENTIISDNLKAALASYNYVIGTSHRQRKSKKKPFDMEDFHKHINNNSTHEKTAILFGTESSGLTNEALDLCDYCLAIPSNPDFPSLNLSHAIQIICYETLQSTIHTTAGLVQVPIKAKQTRHEDYEFLFEYIEKNLLDSAYLESEKAKSYMSKVRNIIKGASFSEEELKLFAGLIKNLR